MAVIVLHAHNLKELLNFVQTYTGDTVVLGIDYYQESPYSGIFRIGQTCLTYEKLQRFGSCNVKYLILKNIYTHHEH